MTKYTLDYTTEETARIYDPETYDHLMEIKAWGRRRKRWINTVYAAQMIIWVICLALAVVMCILLWGQIVILS